MCCTSLRGAAFFGASVHTAVGVVLFARYVLATTLFTFHNFNNTFSEKVTVFLAPFMVYVTLLLALGVLIFHSVEKEYYLLLKWASVSFSLLQAALFVFFLLLRLLPSSTFLPLGNFVPPSIIPQTPPPPPPSFSVPHGVTLAEDQITQVVFGGSGGGSGQRPADDPPDPGGGSSSSNSSSSKSPFSYWGILRLLLLVSWVGVSLSYLVALFLYLRQLNLEDTGHVFGHTHTHTRSVAFYVQPQFTSSPQPPQQPPTATLNPTAPNLVSSSAPQHQQDNNSSSAPPSTHPSPAKKKSSLAVPLSSSSNPGGGVSPPNNTTNPHNHPPNSSLRAPNSAIIPAQVRIGFYAQDVCSRSMSGSSDTLRLPPPQRHPHLLRPQYRNQPPLQPPGGGGHQPYYPMEEHHHQQQVVYRDREGYTSQQVYHQQQQQQYHQVYHPHQQQPHPPQHIQGGYTGGGGYGGGGGASYHHHHHHQSIPPGGGGGPGAPIIRGGNQDPISLV